VQLSGYDPDDHKKWKIRFKKEVLGSRLWAFGFLLSAYKIKSCKCEDPVDQQEFQADMKISENILLIFIQEKTENRR
jgi:hypothetical protein